LTTLNRLPYLTYLLFIKEVNYIMPTDPLSTTFAALADPTRRAILARLALGETSVNQLAEPFEISLPAVSRHLKVLERAGLISRTREAQWRPCKLNPTQLKTAAEWLDYYRKFWEESFDRLDDYLRNLQASQAKTKLKAEPKEKHHARNSPRTH